MGSDCGRGEDAEESLEEKLGDMIDLGRLERVDVRTVWPHEAHDFTPWLAENLDRLSEVIGIPLEQEGVEVPVDQFSADIMARNPNDGSMVLVENQLESTDHMHLGQILTYLAGLEAKTVIWIAQSFEAAHLSAIRWLNEHTADPFAFFGVQVGVVRIGNSQLAPVFDVLERPNEWDRRVQGIRRHEGLTERGRFHQEFWAFYAQRHPDDGVPESHATPIFRCGVDGKDVEIGLSLWGTDGVGIYFLPARDPRDRRRNIPSEVAREQLRGREDAIRERLGVAIGDYPDYWFLDQQRSDSTNRGNWPELVKWMHQRLGEYRGALTG